MSTTKADLFITNRLIAKAAGTPSTRDAAVAESATTAELMM